MIISPDDRIAVPRRRRAATLALLAFAMLVTSLDQYIVVVALPAIGRELGFSAQTLQLVITANVVATAGSLLLGGRAADLFGRRRIFASGLGLFAAASLAGGLAQTPGILLVARAGQGIGASMVFPSSLGLINTTFAEGPERNRALAVWAGAGAAGLAVGVLLGGVVTQAVSWEGVFLINVPLAGVAALLALRLVPADRRDPAVDRRFDLPGALSATVGVTLLVSALVEGPIVGWRSPVITASAVGAVLMLVLLTVIERRSRDPLVPPQLLGNRNLATAVVIALLFSATFGAVLYFLTIYLQDVHGFGALQAGLAFLVPTSFVIAGSTLAARLVTRFGLRSTLLTALTVGAFGAVGLGSAMSADGSFLALVPGLIAVSIGDGTIYTCIFIAAGTGVSDEEQGVASAIASTTMSVGAAIGLAMLVMIANAATDGLAGDGLRVATADGLRTALLVIAAAIAAMTPIALRLGSDPPSHTVLHAPRPPRGCP